MLLSCHCMFSSLDYPEVAPRPGVRGRDPLRWAHGPGQCASRGDRRDPCATGSHVPGPARCDLGRAAGRRPPHQCRARESGCRTGSPATCSPGRLRDELTRIRRTRSPTRRSSRRSIWLPARTSSRPSPTASTARSRNAAGPSPVANASASSWLAPRCWIPRFCCSSSRPAPSTRTPRRASSPASPRPAPAAPRSSRPPAHSYSPPPTRSSSSSTAGRPPVDRTPRCWVRTRHTGRSSREGGPVKPPPGLHTDHTRRRLPVASATVRRNVIEVVRHHRRALVGVLLLARGGRTDRTDRSMVVGHLVDEITGARRIERVNQLLLVLVVGLLAQTLLTWFARRRAPSSLPKPIFAKVREDFVASTVRLPLSVVERAGTGDLVARTTGMSTPWPTSCGWPCPACSSPGRASWPSSWPPVHGTPGRGGLRRRASAALAPGPGLPAAALPGHQWGARDLRDACRVSPRRPCRG